MVNGTFQNCYGIRQFEMMPIDFSMLGRNQSRCNKALIHAPNGVMESSFSKTFEDVAHGRLTTDRIFRDAQTSYGITYYDHHFHFHSDNPDAVSVCLSK